MRRSDSSILCCALVPSSNVTTNCRQSRMVTLCRGLMANFKTIDLKFKQIKDVFMIAIQDLYQPVPTEMIENLLAYDKSLFSSYFNPSGEPLQLDPQQKEEAEKRFKEKYPKYPGDLNSFVNSWRANLSISTSDDFEEMPPEMCNNSQVFDAKRKEYVDANVLAPTPPKKRKKESFDVHKFVKNREDEGLVYHLNWNTSYDDVFSLDDEDRRVNRQPADESLRRVARIVMILNQMTSFKIMEYKGEQRIN